VIEVETEEHRPAVLSRYEAAQLAQLSIGSFDEALKRGDFPFIRVGRRVLIPRIAFERLLAGQSTSR
jgi:excisionase family DNA binding protein